MKAGESLQLTEAWWKAGKPAVLTDTGLSAALRSFQAADQKFQSNKTPTTFRAAIQALDAVDKARLATIAKCGNNPLFKDVKAALLKDGAIKGRKAVLKTAIESVTEAEIKALEDGFVKETSTVNQYKSDAEKIAANLVARQKAEQWPEAKQASKRLGETSTNLQEFMTHSGFENAKLVASEFGDSLAQYFPAHANRLKTVLAGYQENLKTKKHIMQLVIDHKIKDRDD